MDLLDKIPLKMYIILILLKYLPLMLYILRGLMLFRDNVNNSSSIFNIGIIDIFDENVILVLFFGVALFTALGVLTLTILYLKNGKMNSCILVYYQTFTLPVLDLLIMSFYKLQFYFIFCTKRYSFCRNSKISSAAIGTFTFFSLFILRFVNEQYILSVDITKKNTCSKFKLQATYSTIEWWAMLILFFLLGYQFLEIFSLKYFVNDTLNKFCQSYYLFLSIFAFNSTMINILRERGLNYYSLVFLTLLLFIPIMFAVSSYENQTSLETLSKRIKKLRGSKSWLLMKTFIQIYKEKKKVILKEGFLKFHKEHLMKDLDDQDEVLALPTEVENKTGLEEREESQDEFSLKSRKFEILFKRLFEICKKHNPNNANILIFYSQYRFYLFKDSWNSLNILSSSISVNTNFVQNYIVERVKIDIEENIKNSNFYEIKDVEKFIKYEGKYKKMITIMKESTTLYRSFWLDLSKEKPDPKFLVKVGMKVAIDNKKLKKIHSSIIQERKSLKISTLYSEYLHNVVNDSKAGEDLMYKVTEFEKKTSTTLNSTQLKISKKLQKNVNLRTMGIFDDDERMNKKDKILEGLVVVSVTNQSDIGEVENCCGDVEELLGYPAKDLIGCEAKEIIPKFFLNSHGKIVKNFFDGKRIESRVTDVPLWPIDSENYMRETNVTIVLNRDSCRSIQLYVVVNNDFTYGDNEKNNFRHEIVFRRTTGEVVGMTRNCYEDYGLSSSILEKNRIFFIESIFKNISEFYSKADKNEVFMIEIDTKDVNDQFLLSDNFEEGSLDFELNEGKEELDDLEKDELESQNRREVNKKKFKKEKILAILKNPNLTFEEDLLCLKFRKKPDSANFDSSDEENVEISEMLPDIENDEEKSRINIETESHKEMIENKRIIEEELERLKEQKIPFQVTYLRHLIVWLMIFFLLIFHYEYNMRKNFNELLGTGTQFMVDIQNRAYLISHTGLLSVKSMMIDKYSKYDETIKKEKLAEILEELTYLSEELDDVEFRSSKARFFYRDFKSHQNPFETGELGHNYDQAIYRYISSLSSLIRHQEISNPSVYDSDHFKVVKTEFAGKLRIIGEEIAIEFRNLILDIVNWAVKKRQDWLIVEQFYRVFMALTYIFSVIFILDFEQKGFKILSQMRKETILQLRSNMEIFRNKIEILYNDKFSGMIQKQNFENGKKEKKNGSSAQSSGWKSEFLNDDKDENKDILIRRKKTGQNSINSNQHKKKLLLKKKSKKKESEEKVGKRSGDILLNDESEQDIDDQEFDFEERTKYLKRSQTLRKTVIFLSTFPVVALYLLAGYMNYNYEKGFITNWQTVSDQIFDIGQTPVLSDSSLGFVFLDFLSGEKNYTKSDGAFDKSIENCYSAIKNLSQLTVYPLRSEIYQEKFSKIFKDDLCGFLKKERGIQKLECEKLSVLQKGLYTVSIYVIESLRSFSHFDISNTEAGVAVLTSKEFQDLMLAHKFELESYLFLMNELNKTAQDTQTYIEFIDLMILISWYISSIVCYVILEYFIVRRIGEILFEVRRLLIMVPVEIVNSNKGMMEVILKDKKKRKNRRRRNRKVY